MLIRLIKIRRHDKCIEES